MSITNNEKFGNNDKLGQVLETWNDMSYGDPISIEEATDVESDFAATLWREFGKGIDRYIEHFGIDAELHAGESQIEFIERTFRTLRDLNEGDDKKPFRSYTENPRDAIELSNGAYNCVLGSQILMRILERNNIESEFLLPPGHAAVGLEVNEVMLYIDISGNQIALMEAVQIPDTNLKAYKIGKTVYGRKWGTYKHAVAIRKEESTLITLKNLNYLVSSAQYANEFAAKLVNKRNLSEDVDYAAALRTLRPEYINYVNSDQYRQEKRAIKIREERALELPWELIEQLEI